MKDRQISVKELAEALGRSDKYVYCMTWLGFQLKRRDETIDAAYVFLKKHRHPCSEWNNMGKKK